MSQAKFYLSLFHGRKTPKQDMDDWGAEGPIIGPIGFSWTYGWCKIHDPEFNNMTHLKMTDELIEFDGMYYGDFEIWNEDDDLLVAAKESLNGTRRIIDYNEAKRIIENPDSNVINPVIQQATQGPIESEDDIRKFINTCVTELGLGAGFHPDTPFEDYVQMSSEQNTFTMGESYLLNQSMSHCFAQCTKLGLDIYEIGINAVLSINK